MAIDYDAWAAKYDETRGVSPSVLGPLLEALGPPARRTAITATPTKTTPATIKPHGHRQGQLVGDAVLHAEANRRGRK